jgi:5-formyltetrahydrofolate cyclo-ligase
MARALIHWVSMSNYSKLRTALKKKRHDFSEIATPLTLEALTQIAASYLPSDPAAIALYSSTGTEVPTAPLIQICLSQGHRVYLPLLHPLKPRTLCFAPYTEGIPMTPNRYGILEPIAPSSSYLDPAQFSLIFLPLLGFNAQGYRLGMGQGYYDTTLAPIAHQKIPKRIGLAWSCQHCDFTPEPWDIQCHQIITEHGLIIPPQ